MKKLISILLILLVFTSVFSINATAFAEDYSFSVGNSESTPDEATPDEATPDEASTTVITTSVTTVTDTETTPTETTPTETTPTETSPTETSPTETSSTVSPVVRVSSIRLNRTSYSYNRYSRNGTLRLNCTVYPSNANNKAVKWSTNNKKVATVDSKGKVTLKSKGTAYITAQSVANKKIKKMCKVTVVQKATGIKLNKKVLNLKKKGKKATLKAVIYPLNANTKAVRWTTGNKKVATVNSKGKVTAKKKGYCTITATAKDGSRKSAKCTLVVGKKVKKITLNKTSASLFVGEGLRLKATVTKDAVYKAVSWTTSNKKVATVSSKGYVKAVAKGKCTVKATAKDGSKKSAKCNITVKAIDDNTAITAEQFVSNKALVNRFCEKLNNWFKKQGAVIDPNRRINYPGQWYIAMDTNGLDTRSINNSFIDSLDFITGDMSGDEIANGGTWNGIDNWDDYGKWRDKYDNCRDCKYYNNNPKYRKIKYCDKCKKHILDGNENGWKEHISGYSNKYPLKVYVYPEEYKDALGRKQYLIKFYYGQDVPEDCDLP